MSITIDDLVEETRNCMNELMLIADHSDEQLFRLAHGANDLSKRLQQTKAGLSASIEEYQRSLNELAVQVETVTEGVRETASRANNVLADTKDQLTKIGSTASEYWAACQQVSDEAITTSESAYLQLNTQFQLLDENLEELGTGCENLLQISENLQKQHQDTFANFDSSLNQHIQKWNANVQQVIQEVRSQWEACHDKLSEVDSAANSLTKALADQVAEFVESFEAAANELLQVTFKERFQEGCGLIVDAFEDADKVTEEGTDEWQSNSSSVLEKLKGIVEIVKKIEPIIAMMKKLT